MQEHSFNGQTPLHQILEVHPWLSERLPQIDRRFAVMNTAAGRLLLRRLRVEDLSRRSGLSVEELLDELEKEIAAHEAK